MLELRTRRLGLRVPHPREARVELAQLLAEAQQAGLVRPVLGLFLLELVPKHPILLDLAVQAVAELAVIGLERRNEDLQLSYLRCV